MDTGHMNPEEPRLESSPDDDRAQEIIEEARRRIETREGAETPSGKQRTAIQLNRAVHWFARHWVAFFNFAIALYLAGAVLPPVLMHLDLTGLAGALYALYRPFCHQYPFRSWFLFGDSVIHPLHEPIPILEMNRLSSFVGTAEIGYKMALCQRDIAIYGAMTVVGMVYGVARKRLHISALPLWLFFGFSLMPMMLDGGVQWLSYAVWQFFPSVLAQPFETVPTMRALTGSLFGAGVIAVGYPYLNEYFEDVLDTLKQKYGWKS
jgi:uncharacterized membrane protein